MHKKELEELYYIFIDGLFASFLIDTKYCNDKNPMLPFSTAMTNMEGKEKCNSFYHHAISFVKLSSEQDSYLFKNISDWNKDKIIKHIKNYIHDKKYAPIFRKTLSQYLGNDYTFDAISKECLDIKGSVASKAKKDLIQRKPKMTHKQPTPKISLQPLTTYDSFVVPYDNITYPQSTSIPSISVGDAIKTDYIASFIILVIPFIMLFCCITSMVMKCCSYISGRKARDYRMADDDKSLPSVSFSSEPESVQFRSGKICDEKRF
ncbi:MAG: hypothetical protein sL5_08300 [Candidatus Mesenet longicola]|uniref:Uncharacterized protein n=1 Tax=Candidatus Mesenet longicola TaxID=1892558 RepID=A0A8J3MN49_9RICK|nr:MAG: hypothetical protein sGL2_06940 [Candidatus Mesenet longicola]GHM59837.1 MAG: hypothetical protein sL5_08300 [Candidatus Mesenet longicola]